MRVQNALPTQGIARIYHMPEYYYKPHGCHVRGLKHEGGVMRVQNALPAQGIANVYITCPSTTISPTDAA